MLSIISCSEDIQPIDTTNLVTNEYIDVVGKKLIIDEFNNLVNDTNTQPQSWPVSKLASGALNKGVTFAKDQLEFVYHKNIYFKVTIYGTICIVDHKDSFTDNCTHKLNNVGYDFFTDPYTNNTSTLHKHIFKETQQYYIALFSHNQQTASSFTIKNLSSLNNVFIEVKLNVAENAKTDEDLNLYIHYGDYGIRIKYSSSNSTYKAYMHHGGVIKGQPTDTDSIDITHSNDIILSLQLSNIHTIKNSGSTYIKINDKIITNKSMILPNPKHLVDFTVTAYKKSKTNINNYEVLLKSMQICEQSC